MSGLSFIDQNRRELRQIILAIDRGHKPAPGLDVKLACDLDLIWCEVTGENRYQWVLTDEGQELARLWRDDDSHGGAAA